jgi:co-chaperonin GroES (HSP10)
MVSDFVKVREDEEFEARLHFSDSSGMAASVDYSLTGDADSNRPFWGRVVDVGPGRAEPPGGGWYDRIGLAPSQAAMARMQLERLSSCATLIPGDTVCCNLNAVSYRQPFTSGTYMVRAPYISLTIDRESFETKPQRNYFTVRTNEERVHAAVSRGGIWMPTTDLSTDDVEARRKRRRGGLLAAYGEVVAVGPGCWNEGQWQQPQCKPGDLVLYDASFGTLDVTVKGQKLTVVDSERLVDVVD